MIDRIVVAGTDTGLGKTMFAAALTRALDGCYWKPVQSGLEGGSDSRRVRMLSGLAEDRILPEIYRLQTACSPHRAAEIDGVQIDTARLVPPRPARPLVIELAGGLLVPLTRQMLQIDVVAGWGLPVVLCARTSLGTINHTLLSLEALARRAVPVIGVAFIGDEAADSERTIAEMGGVKRLGRLPIISRPDADSLAEAFGSAFSIADFRSGGAHP